MSCKQVLAALDILQEYPEIAEYIKQFNGNFGFMYTTETELKKIQLKQQMELLLDDNNHSGTSWGAMMRAIQAVLDGVLTREQILLAQAKENQSWADYLAKRELHSQEELVTHVQEELAANTNLI